MKQNIALVVCVCFLSSFFSGCGSRDAFLEKEPYDRKIEYIPNQVFLLSDVPSGNYPLGRFSHNMTVYKADKKMYEAGGTWKWFKLERGQQIAIKNIGYNKKTKKRQVYGPVLLDGDYHLEMSLPGQLMADKKLTEEDFQLMERLLRQQRMSESEIQKTMNQVRETAPYIKVYKISWLGWCGNTIPLDQNFYAIECPAIMKIVEKYSWSPWVLLGAFLAGALGGILLGYGIWHNGGETVFVAKGKEICPPGAPAPRP